MPLLPLFSDGAVVLGEAGEVLAVDHVVPIKVSDAVIAIVGLQFAEAGFQGGQVQFVHSVVGVDVPLGQDDRIGVGNPGVAARGDGQV